MTLSAWRPLKDAPRDKAIIIRDGHRRLLAGTLPDAPHEGAEFAPIADTYELDRAVQSEVARAFGELIAGCVLAESWVHPTFAFERKRLRRAGIRAFRFLIHTSMGGRIPDEVP